MVFQPGGFVLKAFDQPLQFSPASTGRGRRTGNSNKRARETEDWDRRRAQEAYESWIRDGRVTGATMEDLARWRRKYGMAFGGIGTGGRMTGREAYNEMREHARIHGYEGMIPPGRDQELRRILGVDTTA